MSAAHRSTGTIVSFGEDTSGKGKPIDYNSKVEKGQVLAKIDEGVYRVQFDACSKRRMQVRTEADRVALGRRPSLQAASIDSPSARPELQ